MPSISELNEPRYTWGEVEELLNDPVYEAFFGEADKQIGAQFYTPDTYIFFVQQELLVGLAKKMQSSGWTETWADSIEEAFDWYVNKEEAERVGEVTLFPDTLFSQPVGIALCRFV